MQARGRILAGLALAAGLGVTAAASAQVAHGDPDAGRRFALEVCTPCHVVAPDQLSPRRFASAPDFRAIANTRGTTATSLTAFLHTPHPTMPNLILSPEETGDVVAYVVSLQNPR